MFTPRLSRLRRTQRLSTEPIAADWPRIADGRPRRLERGVDFSESVPEFIEVARSLTAKMDRSVVITRDRLYPDRFIWVQFADAEIAIGDPCPCGGQRLTRMSAVLMRCDSCGAMLVIGARPKTSSRKHTLLASEPVPEAGTSRRLAEFSQVRLVRAAERHDVVEYVGLAIEGAEKRVLLAVHVPLVDGRPVPDPRSPTGEAHRVVAVVPESTWETTDLSRDDTPWDIVVA